jgi:hypothetical protein
MQLQEFGLEIILLVDQPVIVSTGTTLEAPPAHRFCFPCNTI